MIGASLSVRLVTGLVVATAVSSKDCVTATLKVVSLGVLGEYLGTRCDRCLSVRESAVGEVGTASSLRLYRFGVCRCFCSVSSVYRARDFVGLSILDLGEIDMLVVTVGFCESKVLCAQREAE
jgi:hypothetical protein